MNARVRVPRTLPHQGRTIVFTGPGRTAGALTYLDHATNSTLELYFAEIERSGPIYSLARVANSSAIGTVRIDHASLNGAGRAMIGQILIIGCLEYLPEGPRATAVWRVPAIPNYSSVAYTAPVAAERGRQVGVITRVGDFGTHGWITHGRTGQTVFVHQTQLKSGARMEVGLRVSYVPATGDRGRLAAFDVWPA